MVFTPVLAGYATKLYDVEVLVTDESATTRWGAFKQGLDEVFIRISSDSIIMDKLKRPTPTAYVKQYSYDPVEEPTTNAQGDLLSYRMKIQYNADSVEKYLVDNGFPVWSGHRPEVVIWLVVRDGRNEYVLKKNDQSLIKDAADKALVRRGVPETWPLYDAKDRKKLSVADIRGGFKDPIVLASKRYSGGPALTGSIIWNGRQWQSSWNLLMKTETRHWSLVDTDYDKLINKAVDQAADALGVVFALHGFAKNEDLVTIQLDIQAVSSIEKYKRVETYLSSLRAVDSTRPVRVDGNNAVFEVRLHSEKADFLNAIKNGNAFVEVTKAKVEEATVEPLKTWSQKEAVGLSEKDAKTQLTANQQDLIPLYYYKLIQ